MKRFLLLLLLVASPVFASVTQDNDASYPDSAGAWFNASGGSITLSSFDVAGDYLLCFVETGTQGDYVSSLSANGDAMTSLGYEGRDDVPTVEGVSAWYRVAPDIGTYNIVATLVGGLELYSRIACSSWSGVLQSAPEASNSSGSGGSVSVTTLTDNAWLVGVGAQGSGASMTASGISTLRSGNGSDWYNMDSTSVLSPDGSYALSFTGGTTGTMMVWAISLAPAGGGGGGGGGASTTATTTDITYADWILVNAIIIGLLGFIGIGFIMNPLK